MKPVKIFVVAAGLLVLIGYMRPQQDFSNVQIKPVKITDNIYMLQGRGGNIGVSVGEDGILMVDDQFAPLAEKIRKAVSDLSTGPLKFVVNTHYHGDHTGGNEIFGRASTLIAQENVRKRLSSPQTRRGQQEPAKPRGAWPVITFDRSVSIHFNGEEVKAMHYPHGHTDGDAVIYFTKSNVVHMGDDFFAGRFPFVDLDAGGSVQGLISAIETIIPELPADVKLIPGHGDVSTVNDLQAFLGMLKECSDLVKQKIQAGQSLEQIKSEGLPEKYKSWGTGFINEERWLTTLYNSYSK